jgi:hypothetical protein
VKLAATSLEKVYTGTSNFFGSSRPRKVSLGIFFGVPL